ncbi:MAG TPA: DUF5671 domain-containing protein [Candidatus Paceibacterota bacterium]|nr:DUF5671 domain-containing protein [Candidatus Paceibacterota bacterium]
MATSKPSVARDVFLYLLMIVVLGMSAGSLGNLIFQIINHAFPEATDYSYAIMAMRFPIAMLLVAIPVLMWVMRRLHRDITEDPEKLEFKVRKWLLYLTLFVAGLFVIGDLIGLIYGYLNGDLDIRFALKFVTILVIAASVFYYYLRELHGEVRRKANLVGWAMFVVALAAVVWGLIQVGSPAQQRARNRDVQRVSDLSTMQYEIINFWTLKERLPNTLSELEDPIRGYEVPTDPEGLAYEYSRTGTMSFVLCATFAAPSEEEAPQSFRDPYGMQGSWEHGEGRVCFTRTIDPELYPVKTP